MLKRLYSAFEKFDSVPTNTVSYGLYFILFIHCVIEILYYYINHQHQFVELSAGTPLSLTFTPGSNSLNYVLIACIGSIATGMAMSLDLLLDLSGFDWNALIDDRVERGISIIILAIPSLLLIIYSETPSMPGLFALCHSNQLVTCFGSVIIMSHRLYPLAFTNTRSSMCVVLFCLTGISSLIGFGYDDKMIANRFTFPLFASTFSVFGLTVRKWIQDEQILKDYRILRLFELRSREIYTIAYLSSMTVTILVAGLWGVKVKCIWTLLQVIMFTK